MLKGTGCQLSQTTAGANDNNMAVGFRRNPMLFYSALENLIEGVELEFVNNDIILMLITKLGEKKERQPGCRIRGYAEDIIPNYDDNVFRSHFRMYRGTVEILVGLLGRCPEIPTQQERGRPPIAVEKQLLITLWVLGNPEVIRSVSDRFNVTKSSVHRVVRRVSRAILNNFAGKFICWPRGERARDVMKKMSENNGLPGCIGIIDGIHIPIKAPRHNPEQYVNRKRFHSIQLQGVCDAKRLFTDVYCAFPGSVHDARVCPLYQDAEKDQSNVFSDGTYIIGDVAYPLKTWLITGFKNTGNLSYRHRRFNYMLSSKRMKIEHTFGLLKGRFRKLKVIMDIDKVEDIPLLVISACVLHNICLLNESDLEFFLDLEENEVNNFVNIFPDSPEALNKRVEIMEMIC